MQLIKPLNNFVNLRHIIKNGRPSTNNSNNSQLLSIKNDNKLVPYRPSDNVLTRCLESLRCNVKVWGSSVVELEVKLSDLGYLRSKSAFSRRFRGIKFVENGSKFSPNSLQLSCLRPQLTGSDLLINTPKGSGKTFLYLLPHLVYSYVFDRIEVEKYLTLRNNRLVILLPTIDLVLDNSRVANGCFRSFRRVGTLLYRDIFFNNLDHVIHSDLIYSTPKSFLKLLVRNPSMAKSFRFVVVDESERMTNGEFAYLLVRIRDLLPTDSQFVFLSNFTHNHILHQFTSRFSKLNFKIISFPPNEKKVGDLPKVTRHLYGAIRSTSNYEQIYKSVNQPIITCDDDKGAVVKELEKRVSDNLELIIKSNEVENYGYELDFVLYDPSRFMDALLSELNFKKKTLVYFPTLRMCQFCYIYIKHYLKFYPSLGAGENFKFYSFHTGLSLEKRRFVLDTFKTTNRGILFCTNLAIGINFNPEKIIQISFTFNTFEFLNRFSFSPNYDVERVLLINNLEGHILYEYYKQKINVKLKSCYSNTDVVGDGGKNVEQDIYLMNSCELMYRSLLGFYAQNAQKLKIEHWTIPSFLNEFLKSFGISETFTVSKQFASRTKLLDSPGLEVSRNSNKKLDLIASLKSYPGFISRSKECKIPI